MGLKDREPIFQATDALGLGETALGLSFPCERCTTAQAGGLANPASTYQEPAVSLDVPALFLRVLTLTEGRLLALPLAGRYNRAG